MSHEITYSPATEATGASAVTLTSGTEVTILTHTKLAEMQKSQLSVYFNLAIGAASSIQLRYYHTPDDGTTWYQVPLIGASGAITDYPDVWTTSSPATFVRDIAMSGSKGLKITGKAIGGAATATVVRTLVRDN